MANVGNTGPEAILKQIEEKRRKGITLTAVAVSYTHLTLPTSDLV